MLETLKPRKVEDKFLERMLLNRAWLIHCVYTFNKVLQFSIGKSMWLIADECSSPDVKCPDYNEELMEPAKKPIQTMWTIGIAVGVLIDVLCYKYREVAHVLCYLETVIYITELGMPLKYVLEG